MKELQIPEIVDLASAFYGSAVLFAALDAGVFAAIEKAGGASADLPALAAATGASERGLRMLLDACVAVGILAKDPATGAWRNTQAGRAGFDAWLARYRGLLEAERAAVASLPL